MNGRPATLQEFPSQVHHRIYLERAFLVPLEVSLQNEEDLPADLAEGCRQYYEFLQRLLSGLYDDPLRFGLPAGAFEAFLNGSKPHAKNGRIPRAMTNSAQSPTAPALPISVFYTGSAGRQRSAETSFFWRERPGKS